VEPFLAALGSAHEIVGLVTAPPGRAGRGRAPSINPLAEEAARRGLALLQPESARDLAFLAQFAALRPDLAIVVSYGQILPPVFLSTPRLGCINLHGSLLPRWRGASPVQAAILAGDAETGVCLQRVVAELDAGAVLAQRVTSIGPEESAPELQARLAGLGAQLLRDFLAALPANASALPAGEAQDAARVTLCRKIRKEQAALEWTRPATELQRFVRAMAGWPVARTMLPDGGVLLVHRSRLASEAAAPAAPGTLLAVGEEIVVACGGGALAILEGQREGRARLAAAELARGARLQPGDRLSLYPGPAKSRV
jgi:methionyl-tRNA formyltransferase